MNGLSEISYNHCTKRCIFNASHFQEDTPMQISQIPGLLAFTNKDKFDQNLMEYERRTGKKLVPKTYSVPRQLRELEARMEQENYSKFYIYKKAVSARGKGIKLVRSPHDVDNETGIVQEYLTNTVLIDGYKFDMRVYVLLTSVDPALGYLYTDGIVRFATHAFSMPTDANKNDVKMHLTNAAVNSENHIAQKLANGQDSKWSLKRLFKYLAQHQK